MRSMTKLCYALFFSGFFIASLTLQTSATEPLSTPDISDIEFPEDEAPTPAEVHLGKLLFFEKKLSANGTTSCASCHKPEQGFGDGLKLSTGSEGNKLTRHTPHLYNLAWSSILFWDGRANTLEQQALMPISNPEEMNLSEEKMLSRIIAMPEYQEQFERIYHEKNIEASLVSRALSAFMRSIISNNSLFDRYLAGDKQALSVEALNGLKLFEGKAKCSECHDGPNLTDDSFHSLGIALSDKGRGNIIKEPSMYYRFKTPGLRNVELTAPYMHDGSLPDLEAVLKFYNDGGGLGPNKDKLMKPLNLKKHEIKDLIAFLSALTDPVIIDRPNLPERNQTLLESK